VNSPCIPYFPTLICVRLFINRERAFPMPRVERKIRNAISYSKTMPEEGKVKLTFTKANRHRHHSDWQNQFAI